MSESYTIEVAGLALAVTAGAGACAMRAPFARIERRAQSDPEGHLQIGVSSDPLSHPRFAGIGIGRSRTPCGAFISVSQGPAHVQAFRRVQVGGRIRAELELLMSPAALESGDLIAQPAHAALCAWMAASGNMMMHAAGVSCNGRGLLLIGAGGHGKTTTALAACQRGFGYLGDDLCVVSMAARGDDTHRMHGIFATAKLNDDSRARLGIRDWRVIGTTPKSKAVAVLPQQMAFERTVPLAAIVHVGHAGTGIARRRRLSSAEAWKALAHASSPSIGVTGTSPPWLGCMMALARSVRTVSMPLDWNLDRAVRSLEEIAEGTDE